MRLSLELLPVTSLGAGGSTQEGTFGYCPREYIIAYVDAASHFFPVSVSGTVMVCQQLAVKPGKAM
jgi:hypothetical protein